MHYFHFYPTYDPNKVQSSWRADKIWNKLKGVNTFLESSRAADWEKLHAGREDLQKPISADFIPLSVSVWFLSALLWISLTLQLPCPRQKMPTEDMRLIFGFTINPVAQLSLSLSSFTLLPFLLSFQLHLIQSQVSADAL